MPCRCFLRVTDLREALACTLVHFPGAFSHLTLQQPPALVLGADGAVLALGRQAIEYMASDNPRQPEGIIMCVRTSCGGGNDDCTACSHFFSFPSAAGMRQRSTSHSWTA